MKFGFLEGVQSFFNDTSDSVGSTVLKNAVHCSDRDMCFKWAKVYQNFSIAIPNTYFEHSRRIGDLTDENKTFIM
jgi:hypothetical protein